MACWCESMDGSPYEATVSFGVVGHVVGHVVIDDPDYCPKCGRNLRLPVARMYKGEVPGCLEVGQWWWTWHVDLGPSKSLDQVTSIPCQLSGFDVFDEDIRGGLRMFGPVTVSPEVPE